VQEVVGHTGTKVHKGVIRHVSQIPLYGKQERLAAGVNFIRLYKMAASLAASFLSMSSRSTGDPQDIPYQETVPFSLRVSECQRMREKFPNRVPVIVERSPRAAIPSIDKKKYLVPSALTIGQFIFVVRKRLSLPPAKALFLFCENSLPTTNTLMREIYSQYAAKDGFLYCVYSSESAFGA